MATERDMLDRLNVRYGKIYKNGTYRGREFVRAEHVPIGVGFERSRIADFLALRMFKSHGYEHLPYREQHALAESGVLLHKERTATLIGHEVKVSRSDWLHELKTPEKAEAWKRFCHEWYLVVSDPTIVRQGELPEDWGLLVSHGKSLRVAVKAPRLRNPEPMGMSQIAAFSRAVMQTEVRAVTERIER
jgi:hypothetical protein